MVGAAITSLAGLDIPISLAEFVWVGRNDLIGLRQAHYAVFDSAVAPLHAMTERLRGEGHGTWEATKELWRTVA